MEASTIIQDKTALAGHNIDGSFAYSNQALMGKEFDPSKIMLQVLQRGTDPLTRNLQEAIYGWVAAGMAYQPVVDQFGGWIDVARNWQTRLFLKATRFEWLFLVDADVSPPIEAPIWLTRHNLPIVSGVCPGFNSDRGLFLCVAVKGPDGKARFPTLNKSNGIPNKGIIKVDNAGTGCLMIRRDVLETMWSHFEQEKEEKARIKDALLNVLQTRSTEGLSEAHYNALWGHMKTFDPVNDLSGGPFTIPQSLRDRGAEIGQIPKGEDICFTDRARALGFDVYADFQVRCYHDKVMRLGWPLEKIDQNMTVDEFMVSTYEHPVVQGA